MDYIFYIMLGIAVICGILYLGKPLNNWLDKRLGNTPTNAKQWRLEVDKRVEDIEKNLKEKYPHIKEIKDDSGKEVTENGL